MLSPRRRVRRTSPPEAAGAAAARHATLLSVLDSAIEAFFAGLAPQWRNQVIVMTFSEFGRRPEQNGDAGTDHGTAAPHFVIGQNVRGGLFGTQPSLKDLDDDGNLVPSVDFHQMYAPILATWLGVNSARVLGKAYSPLNLFAYGPSGPPPIVKKPAPAPQQGYWLASPNGHIHGVGSATKFGSLPRVALPIVGGAGTPSGKGLWLCGSDGGIFAFGDAKFYGSTGNIHLAQPIVGMAATRSGKGYWFCAADGGIFAYGDTRFYGSTASMRLAKPIVAMAATPSGRGYWLCASDGGIFAFGDAKFYGSTGNIQLAKPIVALAPTRSGKGYWFCAADGGIFAYGDAKFHGTAHPAAGVCGMARTPTGNGYWLAARDGSVNTFGDASGARGRHRLHRRARRDLTRTSTKLLASKCAHSATFDANSRQGNGCAVQERRTSPAPSTTPIVHHNDSGTRRDAATTPTRPMTTAAATAIGSRSSTNTNTVNPHATISTPGPATAAESPPLVCQRSPVHSGSSGAGRWSSRTCRLL